MTIFISWSGEGSHRIALLLKGWLPTVLPYARPWLSSDDIRKGKPWDSELTKQLENTSCSLVCITTRHVAESPWVNFEAGAVSKYVTQAHVIPLLVNVSRGQISDLPLSRFQCTTFTKTDVARLLRSINEVARTPISSSDLQRNLHNTWRHLQAEVDELDLTTERDSRDHNEEDYDDDGDDLEEIEESILDLVARLDPHNPTVDELLQYFQQENRTKIVHYADCLVKRRLLHCHWHTDQDHTYAITEAGRAYLVEHDLV